MTSLRQQAVKLLARREHSRVELAQKLSASASKEEIAAVLDDLQQVGLLSDQRMAAAYVRGHAARMGKLKLKLNLLAKGVAADIVDACLAPADADNIMGSEEERARQLWQRKFGAAPADQRAWARQARFLQSRGFAGDIIRRILKSAAEEPA